jgi:NitT/TauT family transport system permease protein
MISAEGRAPVMASFDKIADAPPRAGRRRATEPPQYSGSGYRRLGRTAGLPVVFAVLTVLVWQMTCQLAHISPILLPPPTAVWTVLWQSSSILLVQALPTTIETLSSFAVATLLGVGLAVAITFSARIREALYPNLIILQLIPKIALAPLFIIWLGVGQRSTIVIAVFIAFFPMVVSATTGLMSARPEILQLCRSLTASQWQIFRLARFPYAMPYIFAGMKVGVTMAMIGVIVGEFVTAQQGLGYIIMFASSAGETAVVLAAIMLLCVIGLILYGLVGLSELAVRRWQGGEMPVSDML